MKLKKIKNLNFFKEKSLNNLLRIVLSSFLMISFFYVAPIFLNFAEKILIIKNSLIIQKKYWLIHLIMDLVMKMKMKI